MFDAENAGDSTVATTAPTATAEATEATTAPTATAEATEATTVPTATAEATEATTAPTATAEATEATTAPQRHRQLLLQLTRHGTAVWTSAKTLTVKVLLTVTVTNGM